MDEQSERDRLLQTEWRVEVIPNIGKEPWIRVYQRDKWKGSLIVDIGSVFVPNEQISNVLNSFDWCSYVDRTGPSFEYTGDSEKDDIAYKYSRFGNSLGIEPIVLLRSYDGLKPKTLEILEEFRLFHNLYFDSANNKYIKHDESGDEIQVVRVDGKSVDVQRKELRQFLTARNMSLAVHIDRKCFSSLSIDTLSENERHWELRDEDFVSQFGATLWDESLNNLHKSYSWLLAKRIVRGLPPEKSGIWPFDDNEDKQYEEFMIGVNEDDKPILYTSNPDKLADFFGKNPDAPNFLTPTFFRREVLAKYYNEKTKYKVEDGALWCGSKWMLRMDNNHSDYVIVFLGDLGGDLPHKEQIHWKSYNVPPDGNISDTNFRRSFLAEFVDPEDCAMCFQQAYEIFSKAWLKQFGYYLFKPLAETDTHHFSKLRRPLTNEETEFHDIVLSLSILLQDRINKKELGKLIPDFQKKDVDNKTKLNIPVLAEFLESKDFADAAPYVEYLRMLQMLRSNSGTVHPRNEKEYQKAVKFFALDSKSTIQVADDIFTTLTEFLNSLREHFCPDDSA